ncbi:MAG: hypothetical protein GY785_17240 [Gammaproteobacteria bacterium]|nr:hypothetical protein [Gammaproteobacteria bacterium]MCP4981465.1 hypothetical protein [Gammaproteobacteria bacterium]
MPHDIIIAIFVLLLLAVVCWLLVYRQLDPQNRSLYPLYRLHQRLLVIIAILVILLPILVVLSSDPGHSTDYLFWP